jgi:glycosyltransferase involved in cell wall biosynthesis
MFSVIIPTFNNIDYLKLCLDSLIKNSNFQHEYIIHINEGVDGTLEFIKNSGLKYSYSKNNSGVCVAFNEGVKLASRKYVLLAHDDMYFCPEWDKVLISEIKKLPEEIDFFLSGTMVQPFESYINLNCGKSVDYFN